ncbi:MAG: hypothetical protein HQL16_02850 [Candidatus Omnitrophica bacterium]|nr:hypothetical protein [Candidatus Omnitrophota bacterium]
MKKDNIKGAFGLHRIFLILAGALVVVLCLGIVSYADPVTVKTAKPPALATTATSIPVAISTQTPVTISTFTPITTLMPVVNVPVRLTQPLNNTVYPAGANMFFEAKVLNPMTVRVDFYNGTTLLKTVPWKPYTYTWKNVAPGSYHITAVATDFRGVKNTSAAVNVTVGPSPVAGLTAFAVNPSATAPLNFILAAWATSAKGPITQIAFYNGSTLLETVTAADSKVDSWYSEATATWSSVALGSLLNVPAGSYNLSAIATDSTGAMSTAYYAVSNTVVAATNASFIIFAQIPIDGPAKFCTRPELADREECIFSTWLRIRYWLGDIFDPVEDPPPPVLCPELPATPGNVSAIYNPATGTCNVTWNNSQDGVVYSASCYVPGSDSQGHPKIPPDTSGETKTPPPPVTSGCDVIPHPGNMESLEGAKCVVYAKNPSGGDACFSWSQTVTCVDPRHPIAQ